VLSPERNFVNVIPAKSALAEREIEIDVERTSCNPTNLVISGPLDGALAET